MPCEVFLYNVPKVSEDGEKSIPVPASKSEQFDDLDAAKEYAVENKDEFDRVVLMSVTDGKQERVERYIEGRHEARDEAVRA